MMFFAHSRDFYPVPVFYPFTKWGFDGWAWNTPRFFIANYLAICMGSFFLVVLERGRSR